MTLLRLAFGYTDMRKGIDGLAMLVQGVLRRDRDRGQGRRNRSLMGMCRALRQSGSPASSPSGCRAHATLSTASLLSLPRRMRRSGSGRQ
jgi:hypothetical protein